MKPKLVSAFSVYKSSTEKMQKQAAKNGSPLAAANQTPKKKKKKSRDVKQVKKFVKEATQLPLSHRPEQQLSPPSIPSSSGRSTTPSSSSSNAIDTLPFVQQPLTMHSIKGTTKRKKNDAKISKTMRSAKTLTPNCGASDYSMEVGSSSQKSIDKEHTNLKHEVRATPSSSSYMFDSRLEGERCFEWLIHPFNKHKFFSEVWERKPLLLKRQNSNYYRELFSTAQLDLILREKSLWFGKNLDVTTFTNGVRETHNPGGRAHAALVWDYYQTGCSVRVLNPQTFARSIWKLNVTLQETFGCFVGANVYLTPPGSQGFAPHFDDIEAFILQLEGKKNWKLYHPRKEEDVLPRTSSENLRVEDLGNPVLDVELMAGDMLYFPRGIIHQASTPPDMHSLHLTISTCQRNTWGDLFEKLVPHMLQLVIKEDVEFRKALPRDCINYMGIVNSELPEVAKRTQFEEMASRLFCRMTNCLPLDAAVDQIAKGFIHDALPPLLTKDEKSRTIFGSEQRWGPSHQFDGRNIELDPDTRVKLLRANLVRLVVEDDGVNLYHSVDNSREYHADEIQSIPISAEYAPAVEFLIHAYPNFVDIESLPVATLDAKMELANTLYDTGLLITDEVIEPMD